MTTDKAILSDAQERAIRTFLGNLGVDVLTAVALLVYTTIASGTSFSWYVLAVAGGKTILSTAASFVLRYFKTPVASTPPVVAPVEPKAAVAHPHRAAAHKPKDD